MPKSMSQIKVSNISWCVGLPFCYKGLLFAKRKENETETEKKEIKKKSRDLKVFY